MKRKIHIGFSTAESWNPFSAVIRWWWDTEYSHVYIRWSTPWGFDEILEASGSSVRMIEANRWSLKNEVIHEVDYDITKEQFNLIMINVRSLTGKPYGKLQALGIAVSEIFNLNRNPLGNDSRHFVCSEVVLKVMKILKIKSSFDPDLVSPYDLFDIIHNTENEI